MNNSLNDLQLDNQLLASLYTNVLVGTVDAKENKKIPESAPSLKFLGNNAKNVTVLVSYPDQTFLPENALAFLTKILLACQLNIADIAIINTEKQKDWDKSISHLRPEKIISFGTGIKGKQIALFSIESIDNILCLSAPSLNDFITDTEQAKQIKTNLWSCLKQLFQIK